MIWRRLIWILLAFRNFDLEAELSIRPLVREPVNSLNLQCAMKPAI